MATYYDSEGNEVEVFTQEEVDQKIQEKEQELRDAQNNASAQAEDKAGNQGGDDKGQNDEEITRLRQDIEALRSTLTQSTQQRALQHLQVNDAEQQKQIEQRMNNLTGYEETEQGIYQKARDAYTLVVGHTPETGIDMTGMSSVNESGESNDSKDKTQVSDADKSIGEALGITDEMREKYGSQQQYKNSK